MMNENGAVLNLLRITMAAYLVLSAILTWTAIEVGVPYIVGGTGNPESVADDFMQRGTGISAPGILLIAFAVLLVLTWLPRPWRAIPVLLVVVPATVWLILSAAALTLPSGPFSSDIGGLGVALWLLSLATLVLMIVLALVAGFRAMRRASASED